MHDAKTGVFQTKICLQTLNHTIYITQFPCRQSNKRFTQKGHIVKHKRAVHEAVKLPCRQCDKKYTQKGHIIEHKTAVRETNLKTYENIECV